MINNVAVNSLLFGDKMLKRCDVSCYFIAEQIRDIHDNLCGFEILTRLEKTINRELFFSSACKQIKQDILLMQLHQISLKRDFFVSNKICCSVNIDCDTVEVINEGGKGRGMLEENDYICLELSERMDFSKPESLHEVQSISDQFEVWQDDYCFDEKMAWQPHKFNVKKVKIDKKYFWENFTKSSFSRDVNFLVGKYDGVIIEGVEEKWHIDIIRKINNHKVWMQGYFFESLILDNL